MAIRKVTEEVLSIRVEGADSATRKYGKLAKQQDNLERETKQATRAVKQQRGAMTAMSAGLLNAQAAANLAALAFVAMRRAISAIKAPVNLAIDFEKNFAMIKTLSSDVNESVRQGLLGLAAEVPQTAADVTQAAYQALSASISTSDLIPFLRSASNVAIGGATDMTSAVNLLSSAVNAWSIQGMTAAEAADSFFTTVRLGKTTIEELNASLGRGAAVAQFGVSLDTLNAGVAQLTKQGVPTAEAMTKMVAMIKLLSNPTADAAKKFKFLGVEVGIAAIKNKGLEGVLADLQRATLGSTEILGTMSRRMEANSALLGLLGNNYGGFNSLLAEYTDKTGAAANATNIMNDTTQGAINRFNALKEDVLRRLGEKILPMVNESLEAMYTWLLAYGDEVIETTAGVFQSLFDLGKWLKANGDVIATTIKVMFSTAALLGFVQAMALVKTAWTTGMAAMAATGSAGLMSKLLLGIKAAAAGGPWVVAIVGVFTAVGLLIGKAMGKTAAQRAAEELERFKEESATEIRRIEQKRRLAGQTDEGDEAFQKDVMAGDRLLFAGAALNLQDAAKRLEGMRGRQLGKSDKKALQALESGVPMDEDYIPRPTGTGPKRELEGDNVSFNYEGPRSSSVATFPNVQAAPMLKERLGQWINAITNDQAFAQWRIATLEGLHELPTLIKEGGKVVQKNVVRARSSLEKEQIILQAALGEVAEEADLENRLRRKFRQTISKHQKESYRRYRANFERYNKAADEYGPGGDKESADHMRSMIEADRNTEKIQSDALQKYGDSFKASSKKLVDNFRKLAVDERGRITAAMDESDEARRTRLKAQKDQAALISRYNAKFQNKTDKALTDQEKTAKAEAKQRADFIEKQKQAFDGIVSQYKVAVITPGELARGKGKGAPTALTQGQAERAVDAGVVSTRAATKSVIRGALSTAERESGMSEFGKPAAVTPIRVRKATEKERIDAQFDATKAALNRELAALKGSEKQKAAAKLALEQRLEVAELARKAAHEQKKIDLEMEANTRLLALRSKDTGSKSDAEILALDRELEAKRQLYAEYGINVTNLEKAFAQERINLARAERQEIAQAIRMSHGQVAQSISTTIGAVKQVAEAAEASTEVMGILEAGQITAMGVYHGFMAGSSFAQAAYAGAKALVPGPQSAVFAAQASALTAAGVMHSVQAAAAGVQAGMALHAGFKGGGSSSSGGGAATQYDTADPVGTESLADRQDREEPRAGISFGDIVLSDVPALFSNEGVDFLGAQITQSIVEAINRNSAIPGMGRFNERSFRRRGG